MVEFNCSNGKGIILSIFQLISLSLSIAILIVSSNIYYDSEVSGSLSEDFIINFQEGFYMSFRECNSPYNNAKLQNKLTLNHISFGTWQGTVRGCGFTKNNKKKVKILEEGDECEDDEELLDEISPQEIYSYKGISLCGTTKGNYYELLKDGSIIKKEEECPEGKKSCGYIDTIKNKLCFDENEECPVNYIKISDKAPEKIENLKEIAFDNTDMKFYYSTNPYNGKSTETPYIQYTFKIADSYICTIPNLYYSSITLFELDAFKKEYSSNCVLKDYSQEITKDILLRYHVLDQVDNYKLYEENKIIEKIQDSKLIDYGYNINKYKGNMLNLYIRTHYGFDKDCLEEMNFNLDDLYKYNGQADKMETWGKWMKGIISILIFSTTEFITFFPNDKNKIVLELFIKYSLIIGPSLSLSIYSIIATGYDDAFEGEMICSDTITNSNYNIMIKKLRRSGEWIKVSCILVSSLFAINLTTLIFRIYFLYKKNPIIQIENKAKKMNPLVDVNNEDEKVKVNKGKQDNKEEEDNNIN